MTTTLLRCLPALGLRVLAPCTALLALASPAAAAVDPAPSDDPAPEVTLLAPFTCGTAWQGSTYSGHGSNNWNLDLNRAAFESDTTLGSDLGQPILAQADGVVVWFKETGYNNRAGTYLEIDYGDVSVRYLHLIEHSIPDHLAEIGALVASGETIGLLGDTGRASGPHLHIEYWDSAGYENAPWFELPRTNHLPVAFEGQEMVAEPGHPSPVVVSTNCPEPTAEELHRELIRRRYTLHWT